MWVGGWVGGYEVCSFTHSFIHSFTHPPTHRMSVLAPNICALVGSKIASQLMGLAGR